jgi:SnoaL-like domain
MDNLGNGTLEMLPMSGLTSASPLSAFPDLPAPVIAYIDGSNGFDLNAVAATFADTALVNDQLHEYVGVSAIRNWAAREIISDRVTMEVIGTAIRGNNIAVVANIDGEYDKTGLPTPLILTFYFSVSGDRIEQLIILRNKASQRTELALSDPIRAYLIAKNNHNAHGMLACFAEGAVVVDEGHERCGRSAIREWIEGSIARYRVSVDAIDVVEQDGKTTVACLVSGDFPGSPVKLRYSFSLSQAVITRLEIG